MTLVFEGANDLAYLSRVHITTKRVIDSLDQFIQ